MIVAFETQLAKAQWSKVDNRDSIKTYNKKTLAELASSRPVSTWNLYLDAIGAKIGPEFIVSQPSYFTAMAKMADSVPLATWKTWLKWRVVHATRTC